ncbi:MAG: carbohydrate porin [Nitrosomonadales bacterium]|nr:carbohydrate porin [Nitrosomonadales bacterium]
MIERYVLALAMVGGFAGYAVAEEEKSLDWNAQTLTGDWGGTRTSLYNKGIELTLGHKSDFMADASGGIKRGANWMGYTEAGIRMNLEKALGWNSTTAYIHYHSELGTQFNQKYVGSFVGMDNIETAANTAQFNNAWIQKNLADDSLSVLTGLYAIDSEFYVTDTSGLFIQPPYGMANDMAQSGSPKGPPIYPLGALALRVKYTAPGKNFYAQYALTDGVPGAPNNSYGTHIQLNKGDGTLSIMEFGLTPQENEAASTDAAKPQEEAERFNKTAIGFWRYSAQFDDLVDSGVRRPDQGIYLLAERTLKAEQDHPAQGLAGFMRFGTASRDLHQADWAGSLGLRYHGLLDGRDDDIAGIAVTYNHASSKFLQLNPGAYGNQTQIEATYRMPVKSWFTLQPTLQYFIHPNMDPALKNAWVIGARVEITL